MDDRKEKCIKDLLNSSSTTSNKRRKKKPKIDHVQESIALQRVREFIPEIEAANRSLHSATSGTSNSVVEFENVSECSSGSDESDGEENGPQERDKQSLAVEMTCGLFEYSDSSDTGSESSSDGDNESSDSCSSEDGNAVTSKNLRLKREGKSKPNIEQISADER